jgi:antitoxin ParD1/3/4
MSTNVHLTPALEQFARECVDSGRYNNISEVMRAALRLLQEREERRQKFDAMLEDVEAEVAREGTVPLETVLAEMDAIIKDGAKSRAKAGTKPRRK